MKELYGWEIYGGIGGGDMIYYLVGDKENRDYSSIYKYLNMNEVYIGNKSKVDIINDEKRSNMISDLASCVEGMTIKDALIADKIQEAIENNDKVGIIGFSKGNILQNKASKLLKDNGYKVPEGKEVGFLSIGSPVMYNDLNNNLNSIGIKLEGQYNDSLDVVTHAIWLKTLEAIGAVGGGKILLGGVGTALTGNSYYFNNALSTTIGTINKIGTGITAGGVVNTLAGIGVVVLGLEVSSILTRHSLELYLEHDIEGGIKGEEKRGVRDGLVDFAKKYGDWKKVELPDKYKYDDLKEDFLKK